MPGFCTELSTRLFFCGCKPSESDFSHSSFPSSYWCWQLVCWLWLSGCCHVLLYPSVNLFAFFSFFLILGSLSLNVASNILYILVDKRQLLRRLFVQTSCNVFPCFYHKNCTDSLFFFFHFYQFMANNLKIGSFYNYSRFYYQLSKRLVFDAHLA
jgi:hypothetical protein